MHFGRQITTRRSYEKHCLRGKDRKELHSYTMAQAGRAWVPEEGVTRGWPAGRRLRPKNLADRLLLAKKGIRSVFGNWAK
eukprot:32167-Pelagomonas_calceolata.AAC.1